MYRQIDENCAAIVAELQNKLDITGYQALQRTLRQVDVSSAEGFQRHYRAYWQMNVARLGAPFYARYFSLLEESKIASSVSIARIVRRLADTSDSRAQSLHFSFASKLVHTLDPTKPVYDSFIASFYFFVPPQTNLSFDERLKRLVEFYDFLLSEYQRILRLGLLDNAIRRFREEFAVDDSVCNERIIDLLLWGFVSFLRAGAQRRGLSLFN